MLEGGRGRILELLFFFNFKLPHFSLPCAGAVFVSCVRLARGGERKVNLTRSEITTNADLDGTGPTGKRVILKSLYKYVSLAPLSYLVFGRSLCVWQFYCGKWLGKKIWGWETLVIIKTTCLVCFGPFLLFFFLLLLPLLLPPSLCFSIHAICYYEWIIRERCWQD